jgi:hypothetical protein
MTWQSRLATHVAGALAAVAVTGLTADRLSSGAGALLAVSAYLGVAAACTPFQRWRAVGRSA